MRSIEAYKAQAIMGKLTETTRPGPAIRDLLERADDESSPFERYAAAVLGEAGAQELTEDDKPELRAMRSAGGQLVRLSLPANPGSARNSVPVLEDALNRLTGIASALAEGIGAHAEENRSYERTRRHQLFERHGVEYPLWSDTQRGAHVRLPNLAAGEAPTDAYFNEIDWRMLDTVANNAHVFFQAAILTNLNQVIFGVKAPHCSEWDVRTRLASILGGLETSLRFAYKFDCDTSRNAAVVHFTVPSEASFPSIIAHGATQWHGAESAEAMMRESRARNAGKANQPSSGEIANAAPEQGPCAIASDDDIPHRTPSACCARTVYALRMAALLGAACFGSGRIIDHAFIIGKDEGGQALVSCAFERSRFVHETLPLIDSGSFASPDLRFDPEGTARALSADRAEYALGSLVPLACGQLEGTRFNPWEDERELPDDLQRLFHAKRASAIDTARYVGSASSAIDGAKSDSADSLVAAIAQLEGVVDELEATLAPPGDQPDARPLYCEHAMARAAIALLDDELNIAKEAEAFLSPQAESEAANLPDVNYYRAPNALFHAHVGLADLYRQLGDVRGAEAQADRCMALAPTTPVGYALKADALAGQGRYKEGANVLMTGLRTAVAENDQALLLHDLALLFWRMGRSRESSALHIFTASLSGIYADKSMEFVKQLAGDAPVHDFLRANREEAASIIHEAGIPIVPDRTRQALMAQAALGLANAHMPNSAAPYVAELAKRFPTNRAVTEACNSIRFGI